MVCSTFSNIFPILHFHYSYKIPKTTLGSSYFGKKLRALLIMETLDFTSLYAKTQGLTYGLLYFKAERIRSESRSSS